MRAGDVDFLEDTEPVLAITVGDESRAYPVQVLIWHEIVNDTIDGIPVTVSYCPLCNSAVAYDRRLADRILDFCTSGLLYSSALVMYDRLPGHRLRPQLRHQPISRLRRCRHRALPVRR